MMAVVVVVGESFDNGRGSSAFGRTEMVQRLVRLVEILQFVTGELAEEFGARRPGSGRRMERLLPCQMLIRCATHRQ